MANSQHEQGVANSSMEEASDLSVSSTPDISRRPNRLPSLQDLRDRLTDGDTGTRPSLAALRIPNDAGTVAPHNTAIMEGGVSAAGGTSARLRLPLSAFTRGISYESTRTVSGGSESSKSGSETERDRNSPMNRIPPPGMLRKVSPSLTTAIPSPGTTPDFPDPLMFPTPIRSNPPANAINTPASRSYVSGWKDIPTLSQIRDRVRSRAGDVSAGPEPAVVVGKEANVTMATQESKQVGVATDEAVHTSQEGKIPVEKKRTEDRHPLQHKWTLYYDDSRRPQTTARSALSGLPPSDVANIDALTALLAPGLERVRSSKINDGEQDFESRLIIVGEIHTVEGYARYFNNIKPPSMLGKGANYHLFKNGIKPMYEDPANENGGKWILVMQNQPGLLDRSWAWLTMALVGEELDLDDDICGAVVSVKPKMDRIQLWIRDRGDGPGGFEKVNGIGKRMMKVLELSKQDGITFDFQYNRGSLPPGHKFISIGSRYSAALTNPSIHTVEPPLSGTLPRQPGTPARQMSGGSQISCISPIVNAPGRVSSPASALTKPPQPPTGSSHEPGRPMMPASRANEPLPSRNQEFHERSTNTTTVSGGVRLGYRLPGSAA